MILQSRKKGIISQFFFSWGQTSLNSIVFQQKSDFVENNQRKYENHIRSKMIYDQNGDFPLILEEHDQIFSLLFKIQALVRFKRSG